MLVTYHWNGLYYTVFAEPAKYVGCVHDAVCVVYGHLCVKEVITRHFGLAVADN